MPAIPVDRIAPQPASLTAPAAGMGDPSSPVAQGGATVVPIQREVQAQPDSDKTYASAVDSLAGMVRKKFFQFREHRVFRGIDKQLLESLRAYDGQYGAEKIAEIRKFAGSDVYARITTVKCRAATAMLRDVFLGATRVWGLSPTPVPSLPDDITKQVNQLVMMEAQQLMESGMPVDQDAMRMRQQDLLDAAHAAAEKTAQKEAHKSEKYLDDILVEGGFIEAFTDFLIDLPIYLFAAIKGPVVQIEDGMEWRNGRMVPTQKPVMRWYRVSPFDLYFSPGATQLKNAECIERIRMSRTQLNSLIGLPGYRDEAIRNVLSDYDRGLWEYLDNVDSERAFLTKTEYPSQNYSELLDGLEYHGQVQGKQLLDFGFEEEQILDPLMDYAVTAWVIGRYTIKVQINPNPRKRHPYYATSFEKTPGSLYGKGLPLIIGDLQDVANAALRSLVNNLSISSGPQVSINEDRLSPLTNGDTLYPWKRWRFLSDPYSSSQPPIDFFQPKSNAQELLAVYSAMMDISDEVSAIPRYLTGDESIGGAGKTASGLSMLMQNASRVMQNIASAIDRDIMQPLLQQLYDIVMLTGEPGTLRGDEQIVVKGVAVAQERETNRMRQLEFLQMTGSNPVDMQLMGAKGRAEILRDLAKSLGLPGQTLIPSEQEITAAENAMAAMAPEQANVNPGQAPPPSDARTRLGAETDNAHRTVTR